jgi:hypothetical protein
LRGGNSQFKMQHANTMFLPGWDEYASVVAPRLRITSCLHFES